MENHNGNFGRLLKLKEKQLKDMSRQMKSKETEVIIETVIRK